MRLGDIRNIQSSDRQHNQTTKQLTSIPANTTRREETADFENGGAVAGASLKTKRFTQFSWDEGNILI